MCQIFYQKNTAFLIKMVEYDKNCFKLKEKPWYVKKKEKSIYCLACEKKTNNKKTRGVALVNKIGQQDSRKLTFLKQIKPNKKQK